jgi:GGDEF domain-containing protein
VESLAVVVDTPDGPLTVRNLTASVGGATHPRDGNTLDQVLGAADGALFTAKRAGRNAVRFGVVPRQALPLEDRPDAGPSRPAAG